MFSSQHALTLAVIAAASFLYVRLTRKRMLLPPGPKGLPIIGNVLDVPSTYQWITFEDLGKMYNSPIIYVKILGKDIVCINNHEVAREILEKRGLLNADRPHLVTAIEIAGMNWNFALRSVNEKWKLSRKVFDSYFKPTKIKQMRPMFKRTVQAKLLKQILDDPSNYGHCCDIHAVAQSLEITYGLHNVADDDHFLHIVGKVQESVNDSGNHQLVDAFPWTRYLPTWLPGMGWKSKIPKWRDSNRDFREIPFNAVKKALKEQTSEQSIATDLLDEDGHFHNDVDEEFIKSITCTIILGATDTVASVMQSMILCMTIFPDAQKSAQDELDRVVGHERLPDFDDETKLPYVKALYREVFRWACISPLAIPHKSTKDDIWHHDGKEYFIPKDSIILGNAWAMTRDSTVYPDPHEFNPGRYLDKDGNLNPKIKEADMPFGFQPRHCPGRWYAEDFLFMFIASVLHVLSIQTADSKPPKTTEWVELMTSGIACYPKPFSCKISPRNQGVENLVRQFEEH